MNFMFAQLNDIQIFRVLRDCKAKQSKGSATRKWCSVLLALCLLGSGLAQANVTVNDVTTLTTIGRGQDVNVNIGWTRLDANPGQTITVPLPAAFTIAPPAVPAGCTLIAGPAVECNVPAGVAADTGTITFQVRGAALGGFNLTATGTGGSNASVSGTVVSSGDVTVAKTKTSPAGNPLAGQTTTFSLVPNIAVGGEGVGVGAAIVITDTLPGTATDFDLTSVTPSGPVTASCNTVGRTITCTYTGPFTRADLNASAITVVGRPLNTGALVNVGSVASANSQYFDSNGSNNISNANFTVDPATDLQAQGAFSVPSVLINTAQTLTLTYRNNGPLNTPAGGTIVTTIPAGFVVGVLPAGCVAGPGASDITCTAGSVSSGNTQAFAIPLTTPATAAAGNFPVSIAPPAGYGDAVPANNSVNVPYSVVAPFADLRATKSKTGGARSAGTSVTTTIGVQNIASSASIASYTVTEPLRVVDFLRPEEAAGGTVSGVSLDWFCTVTTGVVPPFGIDAARTTRIACQSTDVGSLAIGATRSVSFTSTLGVSATPLALVNTACTGAQALTALSLAPTDGPQPPDVNTANDCVNDSAGLVLTPVVSGNAQASITKLSSVDNVDFKDLVADAPTLAGDANTVYWRMVITTPSTVVNPTQVNIPTLRLSDTVPGRQNTVTTGSPAPSYITPAITVTTSPNTYGSCPNLAAGSVGALSCSFSNVPPNTTITVDLAVQRSMASGALTNTATLSSPDALLTAAVGGQLADDARINVTPRVDVALTSKTVTPASPRIGELVQFTITAQNLGPDDVTAAGQFTITDTLNPTATELVPGYEVISVSGAGLNCSASNLATGVLSCTNTALVARYEVRTVTISARIKKPVGAVSPVTAAENTATVTLSGGYCEYKTETTTNASVSTICSDSNAASNNAKKITFNVQLPAIDMKQRKERVLPAGQTAFGLGDKLRYRFRVQASGPSRAENVVMTDRLTVPVGFSVEMTGAPGYPRTVTPLLINGTAAEVGFALDASKAGAVVCTQTAVNGDVVCNMSATLANNFMDAGKEVNFELEFDVTPINAIGPVTFGNRAFICADETAAYESSGACSDVPATAGNNLASVNDTVFPKNDLQVLSKTTVTPGPADINQPVRFDIKIKNNGPSDGIKMRIVDTLPTGFEWVNTNPAFLPVAVVDVGSTASLSAALTVSASVPAAGTSNVCFVSNGITSVTTLAQQQAITCDLSGIFPSGAGDTVTVTLYARPKGGLYDGSGGAPYGVDRTNSVKVSPGKSVSNVDTAIDVVPGNDTATSTIKVHQAKLGGRVFVDINNNGDQDGTIGTADQGLGNVSLTLVGTDIYGYPVSRTVTSSNAAAGVGSLRGDYLFANLPPSDGAGYTVTETQPMGYGNGDPKPNTVRVVRNGVSTGVSGAITASNTVGPVTSVISGVVLAGGANAVEFDFPEVPKALLSGFVYLDVDNNGVKGGADIGINGVTVTLLGCRAGTNGVIDTVGPIGAGPVVCAGDDVPVNMTKVTATDGVFGLGYYNFELEQPGRFSIIEQPTQPLVGGVATIAGKTTAGSVDLLSSPVNSNDGGTVGSVNVTGTAVGGAPGVLQELANTVAASQIRDIVISSTSVTSVNNNFGEIQPSQISGVVYTEKGVTNSNFTAGVDWPVPGVSVNLTGTNDLGQAVNQTVSTNSLGAYTFTNLRPGNYQIVKTNPAGIVNEVLGAFPGKDAGNTTLGARLNDDTINTIALVSGSVVSNTNFAVTNGPAPEAVIAAYVYLDRNRNYALDPSETKRLDGVVVNLVDGASCDTGTVLASQTSDATGSVYFTGQIGKSYLLCEVQPLGHGNSNANGVPGSNSIPVPNLAPEGSYGNSFGELAASIAGSVYEDFGSANPANTNNGVRDAGELGIANVPVILTGRNILGQLLNLTTTTDASGNYIFDDLMVSDAAGYTVTEILQPAPVGKYQDGKDTAGNASVAAGDASTVNDKVSGIRMAPGEQATAYNFGEIVGASISGLVYIDKNRNHALDATDIGRIPGVSLKLISGNSCETGAVLQTTLSDSEGKYVFEGLPVGGTYTVCETQPEAYGNGNAKGIGGSNSILIPNLAAGINTGNDFGELAASIAGSVYEDFGSANPANTNNGVRDAGELGIANVPVILTGRNILGQLLNLTTTTDASGNYIFDDLMVSDAAGYTVTEILQPAPVGKYQDGKDTAGNASVAAGDASTVNDKVSGIRMAPGEQATAYNFGEIVGASISGLVYIDKNRNHALDATDIGRIPGVSLKLISGNSCETGAVLQTTLSDSEGKYVFEGLPVGGTYTVCETQPEAYGNGNAKGIGGSNSILIPNLAAGINTGNDFGELAASIAGQVFLDGNSNGQVDAAEIGIEGVSVTLTGVDFNGTPVNRTVVTNALGKYQFDDLLAAGVAGYTVTEQLAQPNAPGTTNPTFNGITTAGTIAGVVTGVATPVATVPSAVSGITLGAGKQSVENNFGEVVVNGPDLVVTKQTAKTSFTESNAAIYTLTVKNVGTSPSAGVYTVTDRLSASGSPAKWNIETATGAGWTCVVSADRQQVSCEGSQSIAAGQTAAAQIKLSVSLGAGAAGAGPLVNTVSVSGGGEPPNRGPQPPELNSPPACGNVATQNVCQTSTPVQIAAGLSGTVWLDGNNKKVLDGSDKVLPGWVVELYDVSAPGAAGKSFTDLVRSGTPLRSTNTDSQGKYEFCGLEPGTQYQVLFRDPANRIVFPGVVTNEVGRVTGAEYFSQVVNKEGFEVLQVKLPQAPSGATTAACTITAPQQSLPLDPNGVVYDSKNRQPVPGASVTLVPDGICPGYDPKLHVINYESYGTDAAGNPTMTVGADGFYKFLLSGDPLAPKSCKFRLEVKEPAGYKPAPSTSIPPQPPLATPPAPGIFNVQPQKLPPTGNDSTTYFFGLTLGLDHQEIFNNHIPLDPAIPGTLVLSKVGDRKQVTVGDSVLYTVRVRQTAGDPAIQTTVRDRLPAGLTLIRGTVRVNGVAATDPLGGLGPVLAFNLGSLTTGQEFVLTYRVRVGVGAQQGDGINRAQAHSCQTAVSCVNAATLNPITGATASNEGVYQVQILGGVFTDSACIAGKVFVDCNNNHVQDDEELGIPGVRLYMEDGRYVVTDSEGKYSRCNITPQTHILKADVSTLPRRSRLTTTSNRNLGDAGSLILDIKNGELHRAEFAEGSCSNQVLEQVKARRSQGEIRGTELERPEGPPLTFKSKPMTSPQQGTDSADQAIVQPRQGANDAR